ncbi:MAG: hypothetical protein ACOYL3_27190 [Desulfuromonadaceae bacterium]
MAKKIRLTQEEEIIRLLSREGFKEITPEQLLQEPYKTLSKMPDCFCTPNEKKRSVIPRLK